MNLLFSPTASKEFELLCKNYSVTQPQVHGRFHACMWQAFVCQLASFQICILLYFMCSSCIYCSASVCHVLHFIV